jgi:hypothetical protein
MCHRLASSRPVTWLGNHVQNIQCLLATPYMYIIAGGWASQSRAQRKYLALHEKDGHVLCSPSAIVSLLSIEGGNGDSFRVSSVPGKNICFTPISFLRVVERMDYVLKDEIFPSNFPGDHCVNVLSDNIRISTPLMSTVDQEITWKYNSLISVRFRCKSLNL